MENNNTLGSRLGTRYDPPTESPISMAKIAEWLRSLAPQAAAVQPEPKKAASPSAVEDSRLIRFVKGIKEQLNEEPPEGAFAAVPGRTEVPQRAAPRQGMTFDQEFPADVGLPGGALPPMDPASMASHFRGGPGPAPKQTSAMTFDQQFPANPRMGPPAPAAAPVRGARMAAPGGGRATVGALSETPMPAAQDMGTDAQLQAEILASGQAQAIPAEKRKSMIEMYKEIMAQKGELIKGDMTPEQKNRAVLEMGLAMMAGGSRPGATLLGSIGEAGQKTMAGVKDTEKQNVDRQIADQTRQREEAMRIVGFEGKERDDERADKREKREDERWKALDARERQRFDLMREQVEAAGWTIKEGADGTMHAVNARTQETKKLPIKGKGERNAQIEFYSWLSKNPDAQRLFTRGADDKNSVGVLDKAIELVKADINGKTTLPDAMAQVNSALGRGGAAAPLPAGVPPGSKQIGVARDGKDKGKPVYQAPDGKKYVGD